VGADEFLVPVPGGSITGWATGDGPPVLVLHGGPGLSDYTAPLAAELADGFRVLRYQQRGLAPSVTSGPFSVDQHVADAMDVLDAAGADRAYVLGHSWGGHLAMHLAVRHPGRVLGLVIADPLGAVPDGGASEMGQNLSGRIRPELAARAQELDERAMAGEGTPEEAMESVAIVWPGYFSSPDKAPPMPPLRLSVECYAETLASVQEHFGQRTLERSLPALTMPAVFVLGADSPIPPSYGAATAALIPGARVQVEENCGHFPWIEHPGSVRKALEQVVR
jgi:pimeloyl-ACP methyl ester carboxylesterase